MLDHNCVRNARDSSDFLCQKILLQLENCRHFKLSTRTAKYWAEGSKVGMRGTEFLNVGLQSSSGVDILGCSFSKGYPFLSNSDSPWPDPILLGNF